MSLDTEPRIVPIIFKADALKKWTEEDDVRIAVTYQTEINASAWFGSYLNKNLSYAYWECRNADGYTLGLDNGYEEISYLEYEMKMEPLEWEPEFFEDAGISCCAVFGINIYDFSNYDQLIEGFSGDFISDDSEEVEEGYLGDMFSPYFYKPLWLIKGAEYTITGGDLTEPIVIRDGKVVTKTRAASEGLLLAGLGVSENPYTLELTKAPENHALNTTKMTFRLCWTDYNGEETDLDSMEYEGYPKCKTDDGTVVPIYPYEEYFYSIGESLLTYKSVTYPTLYSVTYPVGHDKVSLEVSNEVISDDAEDKDIPFTYYITGSVKYDPYTVAEFKNYKKGELTVTNTVKSSDAADLETPFEYTLIIWDDAGSTYSGNVYYTIGNDTVEYVLGSTFELKHGESITFTGMPDVDGYTYEITQSVANANEYTTTVNNVAPGGTTADGDSVTGAGANVAISGELITTAAVDFVNTKPDPEPPVDPKPPVDPTPSTPDVPHKGGSTYRPNAKPKAEMHYAYMSGYPDGTFGPTRDMTRAEAAQIFYNLLDSKNVRSSVSFNDVPNNAWYANAVNTLASLGVVSGVGDGNFAPNRSVTRAEFVTMALNFADKAPGTTSSFSDVKQSDWFYAYVAGAVKYGWVSGYPDGTFRPNNTINRAEAASIMNNVLGRSADTDYINAHSAAIRNFRDVSRSYWGYFAIAEATNDHSYYTKNSKETWNSVE